MESAIVTRGLTKFYGRARGVEDVDLDVAAGEVFGYLGPNGAGKTTTIRLLLDLIRPTRGRAEILGLDARRDGLAVRRQVGYVPGQLELYGDLTGAQLLGFFASLQGGAEAVRHGGELAERLGVELGRRIRELSRGNRQKVGLVQAFMHRPAVVVLDEPTTGLDPLAQEQVHELLEETTAEGATVLLSSHVLSEVQRVAHRVGIVRSGRLVAVEDVDDLRARALRRIEVHFARPVPPDAFARLPGLRELRVAGPTLRAAVAGPLDALVKAAARFEVESISTEEADLDEVFLAYYREETPDAA